MTVFVVTLKIIMPMEEDLKHYRIDRMLAQRTSRRLGQGAQPRNTAQPIRRLLTHHVLSNTHVEAA